VLLSDFSKRLKLLGGNGLFLEAKSTSNLYAPDKKAVRDYIDNFSGHNICNFLEQRLSEYHESKYCVLFSTGFWALVAAIKLKALTGKNEVIVPSLTYRRLADVVFWAGLVPVFVDIEADTLAISPNSIKTHISEKTALILAVHPIVNCCNIMEIIHLSQKENIPLIFDAVESVHETFGGRRIGSLGMGEVFSLHASKFINGLEGGYVCTNDMHFATALKDFRHGQAVFYNNRLHSGINGIPIDVHAAFALAGLDEIVENVNHNRSIYYRYKSRLRSVQGIKLLSFNETEQTSFKNIVAMVTADFPFTRDQLVELLNQERILARKYYTPALHRKTYQYRVKVTDLPVTELSEALYINLPCGARVTQGDVDLICSFLEYLHQNSTKIGNL
jgi:dTDP-4-amino-4,6-dideoxygalactose transaminase